MGAGAQESVKANCPIDRGNHQDAAVGGREFEGANLSSVALGSGRVVKMSCLILDHPSVLPQKSHKDPVVGEQLSALSGGLFASNRVGPTGAGIGAHYQLRS
jgi:hypothetical protein